MDCNSLNSEIQNKNSRETSSNCCSQNETHSEKTDSTETFIQSKHNTENSSHGKHNHNSHQIKNINRSRLILVLFLSCTFMLIETIVGYFTGSLALLADAGHMLGDVAALALAAFASWLISQPSSPSRTFGYYRTEILAALANSVLMVLISVWVIIEALERFANPPSIHELPILITASIGLIINLISMRLLSTSSSWSLNSRAAYLEVFSDMLASLGVILGAIIMLIFKFYMIDPILSIMLAIFIIFRTWGLLKESVEILMESAPNHLNVNKLNDAILALDDQIVAVHDTHVWTIASGIISMSCHINIKDPSKSTKILNDVRHLLEHEFDITHTTIQIECENDVGNCNDSCAIL